MGKLLRPFKLPIPWYSFEDFNPIRGVGESLDFDIFTFGTEFSSDIFMVRVVVFFIDNVLFCF